MANRFKFRGFIEEQNQWIYGSPVSDNIMYYKGDEYNVSIIQQFTGYFDINNTEIFEGDIIKYTDNDLYKQIGIVSFMRGQFVIYGPFGTYNVKDKWIKNPVIIGNIIEHKSVADKLHALIEDLDCFPYI